MFPWDDRGDGHPSDTTLLNTLAPVLVAHGLLTHASKDRSGEDLRNPHSTVLTALQSNEGKRMMRQIVQVTTAMTLISKGISITTGAVRGKPCANMHLLSV
ncbi:hypothetical protein PoB_002015700 [Plakobranchus ocellatus]|uniref:Uncharacterized protein n=1 Tax=Plakobranchus ocellatus TaxID=259542 RepID=A0AAV3ZGJ1_9GAST|nr:hypothetical protein PoB_002015700 [Plakobranchus ocellatus]